VPLMMATPVEESAPDRETGLDERKQEKLTTLDRRVHRIT
jgi:hypothetical protein